MSYAVGVLGAVCLVNLLLILTGWLSSKFMVEPEVAIQ